MNDLINMLQTLALVLTLAIVLFVLCWIVYAFRKFVVLFNHLVAELEEVRIQRPKIAPQEIAPPPEIKAEPPLGVRYPCHRCKCRLPETPLHSVIKDGVALLVFKCGRCGKETEIDPDKTEPFQPK